MRDFEDLADLIADKQRLEARLRGLQRVTSSVLVTELAPSGVHRDLAYEILARDIGEHILKLVPIRLVEEPSTLTARYVVSFNVEVLPLQHRDAR